MYTDEFPEHGTEDEKNRWASDTIALWEGARFCPHCHNRMNYESITNRWWCFYCDDDFHLNDSEDEIEGDF